MTSPSTPIIDCCTREYMYYCVVERCQPCIVHSLAHPRSIPSLYKRFHKPHHMFTAPFAATSHAVHPVEMMLQSVGAMAGPLLCRPHLYLFWAWLVVRQWQGIDDHTGRYPTQCRQQCGKRIHYLFPSVVFCQATACQSTSCLPFLVLAAPSFMTGTIATTVATLRPASRPLTSCLALTGRAWKGRSVPRGQTSEES